jgi:ABC-type phosphate transport system permease subunit
MMLFSKEATKVTGLHKSLTRNIGESVIGVGLLGCAAISVVTTIAVIVSLSRETFLFFGHPEVTLYEFFTETRWTPLFSGDQQHFGIAPLVTGTLLVTLIALGVGLPLGLSFGICHSRYTPLYYTDLRDFSGYPHGGFRLFCTSFPHAYVARFYSKS